MFTFSSVFCPWKAVAPIETTELGIVISFKAEHFSKVPSFIDETEIAAPKVEEKSDEKQNSSKYNISLPNVNAILIDNDVKLNSHFNAIFTISSDVNHIFFKELSLSFSEKEFNFAPIFENITLEFGIRKDVLFFSLSDTKAFISPSDIIDIKNFVNKVMNLYYNSLSAQSTQKQQESLK